MQDQSKRDKLKMEYDELLQKEHEIRNAGNYDKIGTIHCLLNQKNEELRKVEAEMTTLEKIN